MRTTSRRFAAALTLTFVTLAGCAEEGASDAVDQARDDASSALEDVELDTELPDVDLPSTDLPDVELPSFDLEGYSKEFEDRLQELTENADCDGLKRELAKVEGNDAELTRYLKEQLQELNC